MFYMFILAEIYMKGPFIVYDFIYVGNYFARIPKGPAKGPKCGVKHCQDIALVVSTYAKERRTVSPSMPRQ